MPVVLEPVAFCSIYKRGSYCLRMPFGLPDLCAPDPFTLATNLNVFLAGLSPLLNIVGCFFKLIAFLKAVPNPVTMAPAMADLVECFGVIIPGYALITPSALLRFLQFIVDVLSLVIGLLEYVVGQIERLVEGEANIDFWLGQEDMKASAECAQKHQEQLRADINLRLSGIQGLLAMVNVLLVIAQQEPITVSAEDLTPEALTGTITVLTTARDTLAAIPGVGV